MRRSLIATHPDFTSNYFLWGKHLAEGAGGGRDAHPSPRHIYKTGILPINMSAEEVLLILEFSFGIILKLMLYST